MGSAIRAAFPSVFSQLFAVSFTGARLWPKLNPRRRMPPTGFMAKPMTLCGSSPTPAGTSTVEQRQLMWEILQVSPMV